MQPLQFILLTTVSWGAIALAGFYPDLLGGRYDATIYIVHAGTCYFTGLCSYIIGRRSQR